MKINRHQTEKKIEEILSYILCHNMSDMPTSEFTRLCNKYHSLCIMSENVGMKAYRTGVYQEDIRPIR